MKSGMSLKTDLFRHLIIGLLLTGGLVESHAALSIQELMRQGSRQPPARPPAGSLQQAPGGTRGPSKVDLGNYDGPARWGRDTNYPDTLRRLLYPSGPTYGATSKAAFAPYVFMGGEKKLISFFDLKSSQRVDAELLKCAYGNPNDALAGKVHVSFWPAGSRKALTSVMTSSYQNDSNGVADVETQSCPADLPAALVQGFGEGFFDVVDRLAKEALPPAFCESEIAAEEARKNLSSNERSLLDYYKTFNSSGRLSVGWAVTTAHLLPNAAARRGSLTVDQSPVAACLVRTLADGNHEAAVAPLAQEGYAIRLLQGAGVAKNVPLALEYLERAATTWHYGSASMRLADYYLAQPRDAGNLKLATAWLHRAAIDAPSTPQGSSASPDGAAAQLFEIYLSGKYGKKDFASAESFFYAIRSQPRQQTMLLAVIPKIPGLREKLDEEERLKAQAGAARENQVSDRKYEAWSRCTSNYPENAILRCGRTPEQYRGLY